MTTIQQLRHDHDRLRAQAASLAAAFGRRQAHSAWELRVACRALSKALGEHSRRETACVKDCVERWGRLGDAQWETIALEHHSERRTLWLLTRFLQRPLDPVAVEQTAARLVRDLQRQLEAQERQLFPCLEETLDDEDEARALRESMTVEQVLSDHPETRKVFEQLFIAPNSEGRDSLNDVAWRHGMQSHELLARLARAIDLREPLGRRADSPAPVLWPLLRNGDQPAGRGSQRAALQGRRLGPGSAQGNRVDDCGVSKSRGSGTARRKS